MKKIIFVLLSMLLLGGCTTSSLVLSKKDKLILNYDADSFVVTNKVISKESINFKDLLVMQHKLKAGDKGVLFYEDIRTSLNFEFNYGGLYTLLYVFNDAQKYEIFYKRNNLKMLQICYDGKNYVNVILQASDTQEYSYVYGFSNEEFIKIYNKIKTDNTKAPTLKYQGITFENGSKNITNWNDHLVYFVPLITPLRVMGRF